MGDRDHHSDREPAMSTDEPQHRDADGPTLRTVDLPPDPWTTITDLQVSSGRIHVHSRPKDRHDLEQGDWLDVVVKTDDGRRVEMEKVRVGARTRILIPPNRREGDSLEGCIVDVLYRHADVDEGEGEGGGGD